MIERNEFLDGAFWTKHMLNDLIPYWYKHAIDKENGGFYPNLSRDWKDRPPGERIPAMISRHVFSFCSAYLLSGVDKYIEAARSGVDYLLEYAWDEDFGGWYNLLTQKGEPKDSSKGISVQLYTNVGLTLYYITTGDERALSYVRKSIEIQQTHGHDEEYGGYYQALNRDLSVKDSGKNKHAHYGYVSSALLNLWLATHDPEIMKWQTHLTDLTLERMLDPKEGWIYGYGVVFDRQWKLIPETAVKDAPVPIGAELTAALSLLRLYHQSGNKLYLEQGKRLGEKINRYGWDAERGGWIDSVAKTHPYPAPTGSRIQWWVHIYGCFLQLQLYHVTREEQYLERFIKSEIFYDKYLRDREFGGVFEEVTPEGKLNNDGRKACSWHTSYHEIEHCLLNYLYLNLYVNSKPAVLHFKFNGDGTSKKRFVSLLDDPGVRISSVKINEEDWTEYNPEECYLTLPLGKNLKTKVTLAPGTI